MAPNNVPKLKQFESITIRVVIKWPHYVEYKSCHLVVKNKTEEDTSLEEKKTWRYSSLKK